MLWSRFWAIVVEKGACMRLSGCGVLVCRHLVQCLPRVATILKCLVRPPVLAPPYTGLMEDDNAKQMYLGLQLFGLILPRIASADMALLVTPRVLQTFLHHAGRPEHSLRQAATHAVRETELVVFVADSNSFNVSSFVHFLY